PGMIRKCGGLPAPAMLVLAALVATGAAAQEPIDDVARFFESVEVRLLELDVVVVDRDGEPVEGLAAADFEVLADGVPVEIADIDAHREVGIARPADAPTAGSTLFPVSALPPSKPVTWLVHVDQSRLRTARRNVILRQLREFFETGM